MAILIDTKCIGCGSCLPSCPFEALEIGSEGKVVVDMAKCKECGKCMAPCPVEALALPPDSKVAIALAKKKADAEAADSKPIEEKQPEPVQETAAPSEKFADYNGGVWVFAEHLEGKIAGVTLELLGQGKILAGKLGVPVCAVLLGDGVENLSSTLFEYGADKVYLMESPVFHFYRAETYMRGFKYLVEKYKPEILLMGATTTGRDLAGAVATELMTGLTADCTELDIDMEKRILLASRPAFGGNIMATILCENHRPQMATVRPKVMKMCAPEKGRTGEIIKESIDITEENLLTKVLDIVQDLGEKVNLADAEIIIAGGRGLTDKKGFDIIGELAKVIGGTVAGSRAAVEAGLIEHKRQIGQTGTTVAPKIYFAIGISGAIQHTVGISGAETVIAINTDPNAPMMKLATYAIQGDAYEVVPKLTDAFKKALNKTSPVSV